MTRYYSTFATPLGDFSVAVDETGAVVATAFGRRSALRQRARQCNVLRYIAPPPAPRQCNVLRYIEALARCRGQVAAYFAGERGDFSLPLAPGGTPFQQRVWTALRAIPCGETRSYGELARDLGTSPRAVGRANATNPVCLIVPCHRVVGADGSLTGFAFGEARKRRLLAHERASVVAARAA